MAGWDSDTEGAVEVLTKPLTIIYHQPWLTGEVPGAWKVVDVMPSYKKAEGGFGELQVCEYELGHPKGLLQP